MGSEGEGEMGNVALRRFAAQQRQHGSVVLEMPSKLPIVSAGGGNSGMAKAAKYFSWSVIF